MVKKIDSRIVSDSYFVFSSKNKNDIRELVKKYPNGMPDTMIAKAMGLSVTEVEELYSNGILLLRERLEKINEKVQTTNQPPQPQ